MAKVKQPKIIKPPFWQDDRKVAWLFFGIAFLLYAQTIWFDFALDDRAVTFANKFVMKGFGGIGDILKTFYWAGFWNSNAGLFRPTSLILFAIEWAFAPNAPHVFHFVNVVLYATCALLLYRTLRELFHNSSLTLPFFATLLWIVFPAHSEVVANVKSGDELLSMIFFLMSLRQIMKWSENNLLQPLLLSGIYFFLSLLSKEGAVLFIPIIFIALYLFKNKDLKQFIKPIMVLGAFTILWFTWHSAVIANAPSEKITYTYHDNSLIAAPDLSSRVATAMQMQGKYLLKSFTGFPLSYDYSFNENPIVGWSDPFALLSILACVSLFGLAIFKFKKDPVLSFGILFYFITFALTSNVFILIGATMADRFLFVPSIGFAIAICWVILKLTKGESQKSFHATALYVLIPLSLLYSVRAFTRSADWETETKLFTADVENTPGSARTHFNYGVVLKTQASNEPNTNLKNQLFDQAFKEFQTAVKIDTLDYGSFAAAGECKFLSGHYEESVYWRTKSLQVEPRYVLLYRDLGNSLMNCKKYDSAIVVYGQAVKTNSMDSLTLIHISDCYLSKQDTAQAILTLEKNVLQYPKNMEGWNKLANICGMYGQIKRSSEAFLEISKLDPRNQNAYRMLYKNYSLLGDTANANKYAKAYFQAGGK